jgi:hypothetical protein
MRHFRTFCHKRWNGRSSLASGLRTEWPGREATRPLAGNAALAAHAEATEDEDGRVQLHLAKVEYQLDRFRTEEFWDWVMQEIAEVLVERGPLTPTEILPELRAVTLRGATLHKEPLTPGTLKKKMDVRASFGRYFEPRDEGRYARRAG